MPYNHTLVNLTRAVVERVFLVKKGSSFAKPPEPHHFALKLRSVRALLLPVLPKLVPWTTEQFVDSCVGQKKKRYSEAAESLRTYPLNRRDAEVQVFIKYEKTDITSKQDPVPRVISPRSPRFNLKVGRYLKRLEHHMFKSLGKLFGDTTVLKGFNAYQSAKILRSKWESFNDPVAVGLDASRFDQHVSVDALKWEHEIYLNCFPIKSHRETLRKLLEMQLENHCVGFCPDGKLKYTVQGTRMSGDMNTSLGNCLLMCSMIKAYSMQVGVKCLLANNGDDCVVFMEKAQLGKFSQNLDSWFTSMGFTMKVEDPVFDFGEIEFCQTKPVFDGSRWIMCRNPHTVLNKDTVFLQPFQSWKQIRAWMAAVGTGGLRMTGGLPVLQNFYRAFDRYGSPGRTPFEWGWYASQVLTSMDRDFGPVSAEARLSFWTSFGITPDEQLQLEEGFDSWQFNQELVRPL